MKHLHILLVIFFNVLNFGFNPNAVLAQNNDPNAWMQYEKVEEAGFSSPLLDSVESQYLRSGASALLVISNGKVVLSLGETTRRFMTHSIRKSFMSALYGIEVERGNLDLTSTLADLSIDDIQPLSDVEKEATIEHLLKARSGVFLPSAYSPKDMEKNLPERGSARPGEKWFYNNWDFNALATIYNGQTGRDFFRDFKDRIAEPIGMEDFRLSDTYYRFEKDRSNHPAYLFNMSARDMARFGQLYINGGIWAGKQVVPETWIRKSTAEMSTDLGRFTERGAYGYLWWVDKTPQGHRMYYASGSGGHRIVVLPDDNMVIVTRSNTYENRMIRGLENLIETIIEAKVNSPADNLALKPYAPEVKVVTNQYEGSMDGYLGAYEHPFLGTMEIVKADAGYILKNNIGAFRLWALANDQFYPEDLQVIIRMVHTEDDQKRRKMDMVFNRDRSLKEVILYY